MCWRWWSERASFQLLRELHVQAVNFLCAAVAHEQDGIIRRETNPELPRIEAARKILQTEETLDFAVGNVHAHDVIDLFGIVFRVEITAIASPVLVGEHGCCQRRPGFLPGVIEQKLGGIRRKRRDVTPIRGAARTEKSIGSGYVLDLIRAQV